MENCMDTLPEELIIKIIQELPIKNLFQCTSVCKSWNCLINSSFFISSHPLHSKNITTSNPKLLVFEHSPKDEYDTRKLSIFYDNAELDEYIPSQIYSSRHLFIKGSCNGLLCYYNSSTDLITLWNPSINKSINLPRAPLSHASPDGFYPEAFIGLGFDPINNDFKVLKMVSDEKKPPGMAEVYSLKSGTWRIINAPKYEIESQISGGYPHYTSLVNGALHWISCDRSGNDLKHLISVFDVKYECFREIMLPTSLINNGYLFVRDYKDMIAVVDGEYSRKIWVMEEYGVFESWRELLCFKDAVETSAVLGFRKNGEVIVEFYTFEDDEYVYENGGFIISLCWEKQAILVEGVSEGGCSSFFPFVGTLALLDIPGAGNNNLVHYDKDNDEDHD